LSPLTKIFIILQLVCSLVLSVMVVVLISRQQPVAQQLEQERVARFGVQAALLEKTNEVDSVNQRLQQKQIELDNKSSALNKTIGELQTQLTSLRDEKGKVETDLARKNAEMGQLTAANQSLSEQLAGKDKQLSTLAPENVQLIQRNAELGRAINEKETALRFAETSIRKLQEQLAANESKSGASGSAPEATSVASLSDKAPAAPVNAKITNVAQTAGRTLIEVPLGSRDQIKAGTKLTIYRDSGYVARATVENVKIDQSAAAVDAGSVKKGETVRPGDLVITGDAK
jgi:chromosome segregation ATPase